MFHRYILAILLVGVLLLTGSSGPLIAEETSGDWLRGTGKDLQIRVQGEVLEPNGQAANDIKLTGSLYAAGSSSPIEPKINGHRFEFWIPVNQSKWNSIRLKAASAKGDRVAYHGITTDELRQAAIDGSVHERQWGVFCRCHTGCNLLCVRAGLTLGERNHPL